MAVTVVGACFVANALLAVALAWFVWSRRRSPAGNALAALLLSTAAWSAAYAGELLTTGTASLRWGDAKYLGIGVLVPSFVVFVLCWIGRFRAVSSRLLLALAIEPLLLVVLLALPATRDLVRPLDPASDPTGPARVLSGPLFWPHLVYVNVLLVGSVVVFVTSLLRRSRHLSAEAWTLVAAALLPFAVNLGYNLGLGRLGEVDLTPLAFTASSGVLARALLERRMLRLAPIAHSTVVERMTDGVLVLDDRGRVLEANPAAATLLGWGTRWRGRALPDDLRLVAASEPGARDTTLAGPGGTRDLEVQVSELPGSFGDDSGRLLVLRDVTRRRDEERRRERWLADQARVAAALSRSLRPSALPEVPGLDLGAVYRPAGAGREIGGDFYDVFPVAGGWGLAIGDVSGKGASSAAITAMARYTLRALVAPGAPPSDAVVRLNRHMVVDTEDETYLTLAVALLTTAPGSATALLALGGHVQPVLLRAEGAATVVGEPGDAVGLFTEVEVHDVTVELGPGDALVLFTDGVTEARGPDGLFGESRLLELLEGCRGLGAAAVAARVADEVLRVQQDDAADDIALLVVRVPAAGEQGTLAR